MRDLLKKVVFERDDANWVDILSTITKQCNNGKQSSTRATPVQTSVKKVECYIYQTLLDKRKKIKPQNQIHNLFRLANLLKKF